jgi:hypothetical protein
MTSPPGRAKHHMSACELRVQSCRVWRKGKNVKLDQHNHQDSFLFKPRTRKKTDDSRDTVDCRHRPRRFPVLDNAIGHTRRSRNLLMKAPSLLSGSRIPLRRRPMGHCVQAGAPAKGVGDRSTHRLQRMYRRIVYPNSLTLPLL